MLLFVLLSMLRIIAIEFILPESTHGLEIVKRQATVLPTTQNTNCRRQAARFFCEQAQKRGVTLSAAPLSLGLLLYKFGLNLGNFLINLVADEIHKMQQQFSIGYLENILLAV